MPFLALGGVTIPIELEEVQGNYVEIGDKGRTDDGTYVTDIDTRLLDTPLRTRWLTAAERTAVRAALLAVPPIAATGDLVDAGYNVGIELTNERKQSFANGLHYVIEFVMHETL